MALDVRLDSVFREANGVISLHVTATADGFDDRHISVQGADADELETALRPRLEAIKAAYDKLAALRGAAQARLDALKGELGIGG